MEKNKQSWENCATQVFWGEIAPREHVLQIYEDDEVFINSLESFIVGGIRANDCSVVIATKNHVRSLEYRLIQNGYNINSLRKDNKVILLDAEETLMKFMRNDWPDEILFKQFVLDIVAKARRRNRQVRAFGEMVSLLWVSGKKEATIELERLWNKFCETEAFCLYCAYPKSGFTQDIEESINSICHAHSKVIGGWDKSKTEIFYRPTLKVV